MIKHRKNVATHCAMMIALITSTTVTTWAHDPGLSSAVVRWGDRSITAHIEVAAKDVAPFVPFDDDANGKLSDSELRRAATDLEHFAVESLELRVDNTPLGDPRVRLYMGDEGAELIMRLEYDLGAALANKHLHVQSGLVQKMAHGHRQLVRMIDRDGRVTSSSLLHRGANSLTTVPTKGKSSRSQDEK